MMEAVRTSESSVDNHFTRQYNPEDSSERYVTCLVRNLSEAIDSQQLHFAVRKCVEDMTHPHYSTLWFTTS
jgi:hypothetical protein